MEFERVSSTDDTMCIGHITDEHLRRRVEEFAEVGDCTVCATDHRASSGPVVNLEQIAQVVDLVLCETYDRDGFFFEHEQMLTPSGTAEVVGEVLADSIEFEAFDLVSALIADLISDDLDWFPYYSMDAEAAVDFEWNDFELSVKHESRLLAPATGNEPKTVPERNYAFVRSLLIFAEERAGLVRTLETGTSLYRARTERDARELEKKVLHAPASELGPAPADRVASGRMNAQGVPMFYVALEAETACAEVALHSPYDEAVVGEFILQQPLRILDLTQVPPPRSPFDDTHEEGDERLGSLSYFTDCITRPVILDENHPVDYVPSQMLTEAFRWWTSPRLDGIAYPSRVREGGTNIVLFFGDPMWCEQEGVVSSRMTRYERETERGSQGAMFVIRMETVKRYGVKRDIAVQRNAVWG